MAQVYLDGFYLGTVRDFDRPGGLAVEAGPHHIEIQAPGYLTSAFEVKLLPDRQVTYREDLRPAIGGELARAALARSSVAPATTFYFISGCYLGNVPPTEWRSLRGVTLVRSRHSTPASRLAYRPSAFFPAATPPGEGKRGNARLAYDVP
jgi:hypothetical protein